MFGILFNRKKVKNVRLVRPDYVGRHAGKDALIIATGPSLTQFTDQILEYIANRSPVVFAANNTGDRFTPDYHAFVNRSRFTNYVSKVKPQSRLLLSPYFPRSMIRNFYSGEYELIQYRNEYTSVDGRISIDSRGIIDTRGGTVGSILAGVAYVMGIKNIYFVGLDGYSISTMTHHYKETDDKEMDELLKQQESMQIQLENMQNLLIESGRGELKILTRTAYSGFYKDINEMYPGK